MPIVERIGLQNVGIDNDMRNVYAGRPELARKHLGERALPELPDCKIEMASLLIPMVFAPREQVQATRAVTSPGYRTPMEPVGAIRHG